MSKTHVYSFTKIADEIYRPLLPVRIYNCTNGQSVTMFALADTGADDCLFPKFIADQVGHDLKCSTAEYSSNQGIGKDKVELWKHPFKIHLLDPLRKDVVWKGKDCKIGCTDH